MLAETCYLLVAFDRAGVVAQVFVSLAKFVKRVRPAPGALAIASEAFHRQVRLVEIVKIKFAQQLAARVPGILIVVRELLWTGRMDLLEQGQRLFFFSAAEQCPR